MLTMEQVLNNPMQKLEVFCFDLVEIEKSQLGIYGLSLSLGLDGLRFNRTRIRELARKLEEYTNDIDKRISDYIETNEICEHLVLDFKQTKKGLEAKYQHQFGGQCL